MAEAFFLMGDHCGCAASGKKFIVLVLCAPSCRFFAEFIFIFIF